MLRAFYNRAICTHQIRSLERLEPEIIDKIISLIVDHLFKCFMNQIWTRARRASISRRIDDFMQEIPEHLAYNWTMFIM